MSIWTDLGISPADVVRWTLIQLNLGTFPTPPAAWPIGVDMEPNTPDNCITVTDTVGVADRILRSGELIDHHGFQIRVRAMTHPLGWLKTKNLRIALSLISNLEVTDTRTGGSRYLVRCVTDLSPVIRMGPEPQTGRRLFSLNGKVVIRTLA